MKLQDIKDQDASDCAVRRLWTCHLANERQSLKLFSGLHGQKCSKGTLNRSRYIIQRKVSIRFDHSKQAMIIASVVSVPKFLNIIRSHKDEVITEFLRREVQLMKICYTTKKEDSHTQMTRHHEFVKKEVRGNKTDWEATIHSNGYNRRYWQKFILMLKKYEILLVRTHCTSDRWKP